MKKIKILALITFVSFLSLVTSCYNDNKASYTDDIGMSSDDLSEVIDNGYDELIANISNLNNPSCEIPIFSDDFYCFRTIDANYGDVIKENVGIQIYYGMTKYYCDGIYNKEIGKLEKKPFFHDCFLQTIYEDYKYNEIADQDLDFENDLCDFNQEVELSFYRLQYSGKNLEDRSLSEDELLNYEKKEKIYSEKEKLGYFFSTNFCLGTSLTINDSISEDDFNVNDDGYGYFYYYFEIEPINDDNIKLGGIWDRNPYDMYEVKKKNKVKIGTIKRGDYVNIYAIDVLGAMGGLRLLEPIDKFVSRGSYLKYKIDEEGIKIVKKYTD